MSITNVQVITKALEELGLVPEGESATAAQGSDMLDLLNQMMAAWSAQDCDLHFPPQDTLSAVCPIPEWAEAAVISNLAVFGSPQMRAPVSATLAVKASNGMDLVAKTLINLNLQGADMSHLHPGALGRWNILTDGN